MTSVDLLVAIGPWLGLMALVALFTLLLNWVDRKKRPSRPTDRLSSRLYAVAAEVPLFFMLESSVAMELGNHGVLPKLLPWPIRAVIVAVNLALAVSAALAVWVAYVRDERRRKQQHSES